MFTTLSNRRRRLVVRTLGEATEPLDIGTLATRIAAREHDIEAAEVTHRQRKSVYTSLHQNHLPKLTDAGFVAANREWTGLRLTDRASVLESHLEPAEPVRDADSEIEAGRPLWQAALASGLCTTVAIGFVPGTTLGSVAAATVATLCATVGCHYLFSIRPSAEQV